MNCVLFYQNSKRNCTVELANRDCHSLNLYLYISQCSLCIAECSIRGYVNSLVGLLGLLVEDHQSTLPYISFLVWYSIVHYIIGDTINSTLHYQICQLRAEGWEQVRELRQKLQTQQKTHSNLVESLQVTIIIYVEY